MGKTNKEKRERRAREAARAEKIQVMRRNNMIFYGVIVTLGLLFALEVLGKV